MRFLLQEGHYCGNHRQSWNWKAAFYGYPKYLQWMKQSNEGFDKFIRGIGPFLDRR